VKETESDADPEVGDALPSTASPPFGVWVTVTVSEPVLPATSVAVTVIALLPEFREIPFMFQLVVPEAVPELPVAAFDHVTLEIALDPDALPPKDMLEEFVEYVGLLVGEVIATEGTLFGGA
jgi:hypothetical protein